MTLANIRVVRGHTNLRAQIVVLFTNILCADGEEMEKARFSGKIAES